MDNSDNNPSTPISPASAGFSTDRLPPTRNTESYSDEEAAEDPHIVDDVVDDLAAGTPADGEDEEGEDLYNDNYLEDYRRLDEQDQYESVGLDDSLEDERDLDQIMADRRAAEVELAARDIRTGFTGGARKLPQMLDQDTDDESSFRRPKRHRAHFRPPPGGPRSDDDGEAGTPSSPGRSQRGYPREDVPMTDPTDDDPYDDESEDVDEMSMYRVQGSLREWVTRDEVRRFIGKKFKEFLLTYVNPKNEQGEFEYVRLINEMVLANKCSLEIDAPGATRAPVAQPVSAPNYVLPVPMKLLNIVAWLVFLMSAYHLWPSTESDRIHTPSHFHLKGLSVMDLSVILAFLASLLYLFGFFGIPFLQPDLPVQPPPEVSPECLGSMDDDHEKFIAPAAAAAAVLLCGNENDEEIVEEVLKGKIPSHTLEKHLGNSKRATSIRREALQRTTGRTLEGLPMNHFDYDAILGRCCELPVGYVQLPVGVAGPLLLDGLEYHMPMATTEGCLVASTNRGCKAITESGGAVSTVLRDGMTRAPVVRFETAARAAQLKFFLEHPENMESIALVFNRSSRYARLQGIKCGLAGRYLYMRFVCSTGDAMGMNMVSKGVQFVLDFLQADFPDMEVISISGNYCTDKKPAALNWIEGRGKSVVCEATIKGEIVNKVLKTDVASLVDLNVVKNLVGSAVAGAVGGFNAHASNIVTAIFIATGQDPAQNVESSHCITMMEAVNGGRDLHVSVTMPCIEVGTVGGGTHLAAQAACLGLLGVKGASVESPGENARRLATIVAGAVLAGELSLMSALAAGQLVKSHMKYNRSTREITGKDAQTKQ